MIESPDLMLICYDLRLAELPRGSGALNSSLTDETSGSGLDLFFFVGSIF